MCAIQFGFTNGLESPLFETSDPKNKDALEEVKKIKIDTSRQIRQVSMKVWNGYAIMGLRMTDEEGNYVVDLNWSGVGAWISQDIPDGLEIIGLKCNT